ncbi:MAG: choice-of-anchor D domain-containing protein, partial [Terriglobales bacterium]
TVSLNGISMSTTGDFAISATTCTTSLAAKGKCTISVTFTPTMTGTRTGKLSVSDSASNSPQTAGLTGTGVLPATLTPATATYASQAVGTTSAAKTFTLTNNQTVSLNGISMSTTGDFAISATTCTSSLAAKGKCTISVTFTPTMTGTRTGKLRVSDSASNSPQTSNLTGTGK